jgi:hypothetical protein
MLGTSAGTLNVWSPCRFRNLPEDLNVVQFSLARDVREASRGKGSSNEATLAD